MTDGRRPSLRTGDGKRSSQLEALDVDARSDRLQLADPFLEIGELDPAACRREAVVAGLAGELEPLIVEPGVPSLRPANEAKAMARRMLAPISAMDSGSITSAPQRVDLAGEFVILAVQMMVDRHHPAVVDVELGPHVVDRGAPRPIAAMRSKSDGRSAKRRALFFWMWK